MTTHREQRGSWLIEAAGLDLDQGSHWQPWLRLTRCAPGDCARRTFDALMPVFASEQAALRYAAELGRSLADEGATLAPGSGDPKRATSRLCRALALLRAYRTRTRAPIVADDTALSKERGTHSYDA